MESMPKDMPMKGIRSINKRVKGDINKLNHEKDNFRKSIGADKKRNMKTVSVPPETMVLMFCAATKIVHIPAR
jgi:hypothetical protein